MFHKVMRRVNTISKAGTCDAVRIPKSFTDVLYLTNSNQIPYEIKHLLKQKGLSSAVLPIDSFREVRNHLELIGTVIIDTVDLTIFQQQRLGGIISSLEEGNIGTILLKNRMESPVRSFALAPAKSSFSMAGSFELVSISELWVRISVNLAYRKKSVGIAVKPAVPPKEVTSTHSNKLAEQFRMTEALVKNLAEELRLAGLVQHDFLPSRLPNSDTLAWATTFLPAEWVSGDIYDVAPIDEQHIGFYVADAVGHAMPAALLTIFLKQALVMRETIGSEYHIYSPAEVMSRLNVRMAAQKLSGYQFATCCYCLLNTHTLRLTYARAGHPYPILLRPGQPPQQLEVRGSLLGVFEQAEYLEHSIQLQTGDKLLLYSDGAEPFIGRFDDQTGFHFSGKFREIATMDIVDMLDKLSTTAKNQKIHPSEVDDITAVGLEIR